MNRGDVVRLRYLRHYARRKQDESGLLWEDIHARKGEVLVCVVLGAEDVEGETPVNPDEELKAMGWLSPSEGDEVLEALADASSYVWVTDRQKGDVMQALYERLKARLKQAPPSRSD